MGNARVSTHVCMCLWALRCLEEQVSEGLEHRESGFNKDYRSELITTQVDPWSKD